MEGGLNTTDNNMPKRVGHLYEQLSDWSNIVDAEKVTTSGRLKNTGVARHVKNRWYNLVTLQHRIEDGSMRTDEYSHETRISGQDMLGYVYYGDGRMWWRESNKKKWLRRRKGVKNPKRRRDIDAAAWAMLKWCGWHGKELFEKVTGRRVAVKDGKYRLDMSIMLKDSGIRINERTDSEGRPFIDRPKIGMGMVIGKSVTVTRWIKGIRTSQGEGRYGLEVLFMGSYYKLIVNSVDIKHLVDEMERAGVTRFTTVFYDKGGLKYSYREDDTAIDEMHGKAVEERDGKMVYASTGEEVELINNL